MSLSVKITNNRCEAHCVYCYEHALRNAGPSASDRPFRMEAVMAQIQREYEEQRGQTGGFPGDIYLHGGEALTAGHEVVEAIMRKAYELTGHTNIQTYGYLIDDRYIRIFKRYNASVGISVDGPWPLNRARVVPGRDTREITETVMRNIVRLRAEGIQVSVIVVLHKLNALPEPRKALKDWILWLKELGVASGRLNLMHSDYHRYGKALELTEEEAEDAWRDLFRFTVIENDGLYWQPFRDAIDSLLGLAQGTCVFGACPYYHAAAEPVILSDGHTANCLKTAKTGHMYPRYEQRPADVRGFGGVRYEVLPLVPQDAGGCQGCRYWRNCTGGCPSEGIGGDWRHKTRFCRAYYGLFEEAEKYLRRILPNVRLTTDAPDSAFPSANSVQGMREPALRYMMSQYTQAPSSWRGEAIRRAVPVMQVPAWPGAAGGSGGHSDGVEHLDGAVRHLDSGHGDHSDHKDSAPVGVPGQGAKGRA